MPGVSTDRTPDYRVHHLTTGRVVAVLLMFAVAFSVVDLVRRGALGSTVPGLLFLLGGCCLGYVLGLRPAVAESVDAVEVRNPLRTTRIPWASITDVDVTDVMRIHAGDLVVRCFALPRRRPPVTRHVRSAQRYGFALPPTKPDIDPVDQAELAATRQPGLPSSTPAEGRAEALAVRLRRMAESGRRVASGRGDAEAPAVTGPALAPDATIAALLAVVLALAGILGAVL
jgi:hypothetical protein